MIGIFDSGSGGLTVLRALRSELPSADVVYYGDIKHAPYGERTREEITGLTIKALQTLQSSGATSVISACNSVSASMAMSLHDVFDFKPEHIIEMIGPTVSWLKTAQAKIAVAATPATIKSNLYQNACAMLGLECVAIPLPGLAGAIEFGDLEASAHILRNELPPLESGTILVLGCTHYPLVIDMFTDILGTQVQILDPAIAVAQRAKARLWPREVGEGTTHFIVTAESSDFRDLVSNLFPDHKYEITVISS